jgi:hypothetical protein
MSVELGFKFPDGWLWANIIPVEFVFKAIYKICLISTIVEDIPPLDTLYI